MPDAHFHTWYAYKFTLCLNMGYHSNPWDICKNMAVFIVTLDVEQFLHITRSFGWTWTMRSFTKASKKKLSGASKSVRQPVNHLYIFLATKYASFGRSAYCRNINKYVVTIESKVRHYEKKLLLRCIHHFKSDLINNMDHMRSSGTELSSVIQSQTKCFKSSTVMSQKCQIKLKPKGIV